VYGLNSKRPFVETDLTRQPLNLYAATKIANESIAHSYSHLFGIPSSGLRFFTVYGPAGRPDMSPFIFARKIMRG
jgi:UDP-glucuronate 4-epimerase